jgi:hypothetical protein
MSVGRLVDVVDEDFGAWVVCPRCGERIGLGSFVESDEELRTAVSVCPSCAERVNLPSG